MPCSISVAARLGLAGLSGDEERPRLARSAVGVLLFSLIFGGVLLGGLAQGLSLGSFLITGFDSPVARTPGDERAETDLDVFTGLRLSLSFSLDGVCLLGLDSAGALAGDVLPGCEELVESEREGDGVSTAQLSGLVLCATVVREGDWSLVGLALNLDVAIASPLRPLGGDDLVSATVLGLTRCSSLFFLGVKCEDTTRRTWWAWGGRRLASSSAFNLAAVRLTLAVDGLPLVNSPSPAKDNRALRFPTPGPSCFPSYVL